MELPPGICFVTIFIKAVVIVVLDLEQAATAALAAISNSPAHPAVSPSSTGKRRVRARRLAESKAPHIMTSFDKDLNLAAITEVLAGFIEYDTCEDKSLRVNNASVLLVPAA